MSEKTIGFPFMKGEQANVNALNDFLNGIKYTLESNLECHVDFDEQEHYQINENTTSYVNKAIRIYAPKEQQIKIKMFYGTTELYDLWFYFLNKGFENV